MIVRLITPPLIGAFPDYGTAQKRRPASRMYDVARGAQVSSLVLHIMGMKMRPTLCTTIVAAAFLNVWSGPVALREVRAEAAQGPLVPKPFPGTAPAKPSEPSPLPPSPAPAPPVAAPTRPPSAAPSIEPAGATIQPPAGLPVYPSADFIEGFDAGLGQRYYLYGTDMPYEDIVAYYRSTLKNSGRELFREPPTRQFDLGRFQENAMAYPPSVVVKDYTWNGSAGFLAVSGTTEKRYRTIIQIVPATAAE
jgi:hypothetical protein